MASGAADLSRATMELKSVAPTSCCSLATTVPPVSAFQAAGAMVLAPATPFSWVPTIASFLASGNCLCEPGQPAGGRVVAEDHPGLPQEVLARPGPGWNRRR